MTAWDYFKLMPDCVAFAEFLTQSARLGKAEREANDLVAILKGQVESLKQKYLEKFPQHANVE